MVVVASLLAARGAGAQCEITGPTALCDGTAQLCAPSGNYMYEWTGPNFFFSEDRCITVTTPGSYLLSVMDLSTGAESGPCRHDVSPQPSLSCSITGPASVCDGATVELCGTDGNYTYAWSGPGGFTSSSRCVTVGAAGTYSLVATDLASGCAAQACQHDLAVTPAPVATISGPDAVCSGSTVDLCGPSGAWTYAWSGPNGFTASSACATVGTGGVYRLVLQDPTTGCASAPAEHAVASTDCRTVVSNCPRPASVWMRACRADEHSAVGLGDGVLAEIGASVDANCDFFHWSDPRDGLCAVLHPTPSTLGARAARQFAAVWANVCVGALGHSSAPGSGIALNPATHVELPEASTTIGEWLASTDQELAALAQRPARDKDVRAAYRRIITVGWNVNHGRGIGPVCGGAHTSDPNSIQTLSAGTSSSALLLDDEPLDVELAADEGAMLALRPAQPNPFSIQARIGFTVSSASSENVTIGVYDLSGRLVHTLASGAFAPGAYEVLWDGRDDRGGIARNGMYFVHGQMNGGRVEGRVSLLR